MTTSHNIHTKTNPSTLLLSRDDLHEITGAKLPGKTKELLRAHGIRFVDRMDGWPATTWAAVNVALGCNEGMHQKDEEPNLNFLTAGK